MRKLKLNIASMLKVCENEDEMIMLVEYFLAFQNVSDMINALYFDQQFSFFLVFLLFHVV